MSNQRRVSPGPLATDSYVVFLQQSGRYPKIGIVLYSSSWWVQYFSEKRQSYYSCCRCWVLRLADRWSLLILSKNPRPSMSILTPPQLSIQIWYALERTPTKITTASMFSNSIPP